MSDIYSDHLNSEVDLILRTRDYKQFCSLTWIEYAKTKGGWIEGLYKTIKKYPYRYWYKHLHFPNIERLESLFTDIKQIKQDVNMKESYYLKAKGYYFLSVIRTDIDQGTGLYFYAKPKPKFEKYFNDILVDGLGCFQIIKQSHNKDDYLVTAEGAKCIGSRWVCLLKTSQVRKLENMEVTEYA